MKGDFMKFNFETSYNQKSLSVMAKCIRKTSRKSKSKRSTILGWVVILFALFLCFYPEDGVFVINSNKVITFIVALIIFVVLIFQDKINGYFAKRHMLKGTEIAKSFFDTENRKEFVSETAVGKSQFSFDKIQEIAETSEYFVFIFSQNHAQIYDKNKLSGGSVDDFRAFLKDVTGKGIVSVK
ncbi:MAG: YcxB family protein [Ruminococcaceae bacterium]|nr:YcxB family protein [Oscillospiraceae bacterium]